MAYLSKRVYELATTDPVTLACPPVDTDLSTLLVYLNGVLKTLTTHYTYNSGTNQITYTGSHSIGDILEIKRESGLASRKVDFQDAVDLTQSDLDMDGDQAQALIQELSDRIDDCLDLDPSLELNYNAGSKQIKNIANGTDDQDAVTKSQLDANSASDRAYADATAAEASDIVRDYADAQDLVNLNIAKAYADGQDSLNSTADRAYADAQDDAHSAANQAYADAQDDAHSAIDQAYADAKDVLNLASAKAYTDALSASINTTVASIIRNALAAGTHPDSAIGLLTYVPAGSKVAATPVDFTNGLVFLGGVAQDPATDYTHVASSNIIEFNTEAKALTRVLVCPVDSSTTMTATVSGDTITFSSVYDYGLLFINGVLIPPSELTHTVGTDVVTLSDTSCDGMKAMIFVAPLIGEDERTFTPGDPKVTFTITFTSCITFLNGIAQADTVDYSHPTGSDYIIFSQQPPEPAELVTYFFGA